MRQAWCGLLLQSAPAYTVVPVQPPHSLSVYLTEPNDHCSHHLLRAHTVRYAHSLQAWPTVYSTLQQHLQRTLRSCIKKWPCLLPTVQVVTCQMDETSVMNRKWVRVSRDGWVGSQNLMSGLWGPSLSLGRKCSCFLCLQLVSLKSAETSLREGFK